MTGPSTSAARNPWITRAGAFVFAALGISLLIAVGGPGSATAGYGTPTPTTPTCSGYHAVCTADVSGVKTSPATPKAGKGFRVEFATSGGGKYTISARRKGTSASTHLGGGVVGAGDATVNSLGKNLKAGSYTLTVKITLNQKSDSATHALTIKH